MEILYICVSLSVHHIIFYVSINLWFISGCTSKSSMTNLESRYEFLGHSVSPLQMWHYSQLHFLQLLNKFLKCSSSCNNKMFSIITQQMVLFCNKQLWLLSIKCYCKFFLKSNRICKCFVAYLVLQLLLFLVWLLGLCQDLMKKKKKET